MPGTQFTTTGGSGSGAFVTEFSAEVLAELFPQPVKPKRVAVKITAAPANAFFMRLI
jgi:hypothetical protein